MAVDTLRFDKVDFYAQNRENFIGQERTGIKQALAQCIASEEWDRHTSMKEDSWFSEKIPEVHGEIKTVGDAWEALIYQEEVLAPEFSSLQERKNTGLPEHEYVSSVYEKDTLLTEEEKHTLGSDMHIVLEKIRA